MNVPSKIQRESALFRSNRSQAVRIPKDMEFPDELKKVVVRKVGKSIILTPKNALWDDFFDEPGLKDFPDREPQGEYEVREEF
jgi:antitoxin VapB